MRIGGWKPLLALLIASAPAVASAQSVDPAGASRLDGAAPHRLEAPPRGRFAAQPSRGLDTGASRLALRAAPLPALPPPAAPSLFGTVALPVAFTPMNWRWRRVNENGTRPAALQDLAGEAAPLPRRDQILLVNRHVNQAIAYRSDRETWGRADHWATAEETMARGAGDCEDIAIAKMHALRLLGFDPRDLYLVVGRGQDHGDHAALLVHVGEEFLVLDDRREALLPASAVADFAPVMSFGSGAAWVHGRRVAERKGDTVSTGAAGGTR